MNSSQPTYRYPGAQPFKTSQQNIFFGRKEDIQQLYELISLENLVVLYGKSGLGKSSLLNAGILPKVEAESDFEPLYIRFGAHIEGSEVYSSPLLTSISHLQTPDSKEESSYLDKLLPNENSLWYHTKKRQQKLPQKLADTQRVRRRLILIFDQFEELFTYPKADIQAFGQQLKELLNRQIPQRFRAALEAQFDTEELQLSEEELEQLHDAFEVKVVMAIRSDRMSLLNDLKDSLPNILRHCYELQALSEEQAEDAILNPAHKKDTKFISPPFDYDNEALDNILAFLTKDYQQKVESFQLQIVCEAIEKKVIAQQLSVVTAEVIGNLAHILKNHYDYNIAALGTAEEQLAARKLIEEGLILEEEERRLSLYEGQIYRKYGISPELLQKLVNSHLLRAEPSMQGGYTYELSHDTLVSPVLMAKKRRIEKEEKQRLEAERIAREKELAEQKRQLELERQRKAELANALQEAERQKEIAEQKQREAERSEKQAKQRTGIALFLFLVAILALGVAGWQYFEAKESFQKLIRDMETQLEEAEVSILALDYETALLKIDSSTMLRVEQLEPKIVNAYMELVFWYTESHQYDKAREILQATLNYSHNGEARILLQKANEKGKEREYLQESLKVLGGERYEELQKRYYPTMIEVKEGIVEMGQGDNFKVKVSDFAMAETETTVFQFALYCQAAYGDKWKINGEYAYMESATAKDDIGLHPVASVNWYDAVKYSNWLSKQQGEKTAYSVDENLEDSNNQNENDDLKWTVNLDTLVKNGFRLPSEAEWEYAAKGGELEEEFEYSGSNTIEEVAWYGENSERRTHPVAMKKPNGKGLYDMSGNLFEWCFDWYGKYPNDSLITEYFGIESGRNRILRGGGWFYSSEYCRVANRDFNRPNARLNDYGFRVAHSSGGSSHPSFELKKEEERNE